MAISKSHTYGATSQKAMDAQEMASQFRDALSATQPERPETQSESLARLVDRCQELTRMMYETQNHLDQMTKEQVEAQMQVDDIMSQIKASAHSNSPWGASNGRISINTSVNALGSAGMMVR